METSTEEQATPNGNVSIKLRLVFTKIILFVYYAFFACLIVATFKMPDASIVFSFGVAVLLFVGSLYGWYSGFLSRIKALLFLFVAYTTNWLIASYAYLVTTSMIHIAGAMVANLILISLILSCVTTPKVSTGAIDSIAGVIYQLLITITFIVILGLISHYKPQQSEISQRLEKRVSREIVKYLFPVAKKMLISPKNQYLIESQDDGKGFLLALGVEQGMVEAVDGSGERPNTGDKIRDLIRTPIPFRGGYYRIKSPRLMTIAEKYIREMMKKHQMQQLGGNATNR